MEQRTCHCGESFAPRSPNQKHCSRRCNKRASKATEAQRWWMCHCRHCSVIFTFQGASYTAHKRRYCSLDCDARAKSIRYSAPRFLPALVTDQRPVHTCWALSSRRQSALAAPAEVPGPRRIFTQGRCDVCGVGFCAASYNPNRPALYCSDRCRKRSAHRARRVRKRGAYVERVYRLAIYERDGWRCQLCGGRVKRSAVAPHPKAPVLDHIVPLARGGTHEPSNVQLAHFMCNSEKGERTTLAGEQLRLIG